MPGDTQHVVYLNSTISKLWDGPSSKTSRLSGAVEDGINTNFFCVLPTVLLWMLFNHRPGLLVERKSFLLILAGSTASFIVGLVMHFTAAGRNVAIGGLFSPLVSLWLFRGLRCLFVHRLRREPKSTFLNWDEGLGPDRLFNFAYFILSFGLLVLLGIIMRQLAMSGW